MAQAHQIQLECQNYPLNQECYQWTAFDKEKCKVYQVRTKKARRTVFVSDKGTDHPLNAIGLHTPWTGITSECKGVDPLSRGMVNL
jgi:hypothetical protein